MIVVECVIWQSDVQVWSCVRVFACQWILSGVEFVWVVVAEVDR